jgi:hypothetical protein
MQKQTKKNYNGIKNNYLNFYNLYLILMYCMYTFIDKDEIHNNPNLHSEEQDELELPDGKISFIKCRNIFDYFTETP